MSWADDKLTVIDFESTGKDAETAKIVTCAVVVDDPDAEQLRYEWVAQQEVPEEAAKIHGYTTERCMDEGRPETEVLGEICEVLRTHWTPAEPLSAFNIVYDLTVLDRRNIALGGPWPTGRTDQRGGPVVGTIVDPYVLDRTLGRRRRGKRTLNLVCEHYGVQLDPADAHTAIGDVLATLGLVRTMARRIPRIRETDLRQLYRDQQAMHAAWALDMQAFIRSKKREDMIAGRDFDGRPVTQEDIDAVIITGDWPIVPRLDVPEGIPA